MSEMFTGVAAELWQVLSGTYDPLKIIEGFRRVEELEAERDELRQTLLDLTAELERINSSMQEDA